MRPSIGWTCANPRPSCCAPCRKAACLSRRSSRKRHEFGKSSPTQILTQMLAAEDLGEAARIERKRDRFSHGWRGLADTQPPIVFGAVSGAHHHRGGAAQFVVEAGLHDLALDRRLAQLFRRPRAVKTPLVEGANDVLRE